MYKNKVFASYDNKIFTVVTSEWTIGGKTSVKLGNGDVWDEADFLAYFVEVDNED